jgi:YcxB-like protein
MQIEYKLSEKEFLMAHNARMGWRGRFVPLFGCLLGLAAIVDFVRYHPHGFTDLGVIVIGLGLALGPRWALSSAYRRDKRLHDPFVASFSDDGVKISGSTGTSTHPWSTFTKVVETKSQFLLFQGPACFNIFPKQYFGSGEAQAFRDLVGNKVSGAEKMSGKGLSVRTWMFIVLIAVAFVLMLIVIRNATRQSTPTSKSPPQSSALTVDSPASAGDGPGITGIS